MTVNKRYYIQIFIIYWLLFSGSNSNTPQPNMRLELVMVYEG